MNPALQGLLTIIIGVGGCVSYFYFSNMFLDKVLFPTRKFSEDQLRPHRLKTAIFVGAFVFAIAFAFLLLPLLVQWISSIIKGDPLTETIVAAFALRRIVLVLIVGGLGFGLAYLLVGGGQPNIGRNINRAEMIRPWLFVAPAVLALSLYLAYPVFATLWYSVTDRSKGDAFVGFANYRQMFSEPKFWEAMSNNMLWLIVVPAAATAFGLLAAQLTDRIRWGQIAKSLIFMPMAISFVGAAVIFKLIYDTRPVDSNQIGVLNAVWLLFDGGVGSVVMLRIVPALCLAGFAAIVGYVGYIFARPIFASEENGGGWGFIALRALVAVGAVWLIWLSLGSIFGLFTASFPYGEPQNWLTIPFWNSFLLMVVLIWIQTGFAMVILSAALRGIPEETIEAAIIDGANPLQIFFKIKVPQIMGTIVVVWTTITIVVLKVFDIVFAMTNGQWETQVLANYMYDKLFRANDWGVGSAAAMTIMLLVTPILVWNVYNARKEMR